MNYSEEKKKTIGNTMAIAVIVIFVIVMLASHLMKLSDIKKKTDITQKDASRFVNALAFKDKDKDVMESWAKGRLKDAWGNSFRLDSNSISTKLVSMGNDLEFDTKDDISYSITRGYREERIKEVSIKLPEKKSKGWSFSWSWGSKSKEK